MSIIMDVVAIIFLILGIAFAVFGAVGVLRLPDTYSRLHASGKTSTLSILFFCVAVALILPEAAPKLLVLAAFLVFSAPVASHAIGSAVHRSERIQAEHKRQSQGDAAADIEDMDDSAAQRA